MLVELIWITSDTHFNHQNILAYEPESRPFNTVEEMNETIINNWNSKISPTDDVYHLGDFFMGQQTGIEPILKRLNGNITLIRGNHDTPNRIAIYKQHGIEVKDIDYLSYHGKFFILCHFPIASPEFIQMVRTDNSEAVVLYGHVHHNALRGYVDGTYHVGLDTNNLMPLSLYNIWQECCQVETNEIEEKESFGIWEIEIGNPIRNGDKELPCVVRRCNKCVYLPSTCCHSDNMGHCVKYKRDPPDGGLYN